MQKLTPSPSAPAAVPTTSKTPPSKTPSPSGKSGGPRAAAATSPIQGKAVTAGGGPHSGGMATRSTSHPNTSPKATRSNTNQSINTPGHTPNVPQHKGMVTRTTAQRACQQNFQTRQQKWRWTK